MSSLVEPIEPRARRRRPTRSLHRGWTAVLCALSSGCTGGLPALTADGLEDMQAMVVLVEAEGGIRAYAHPFAGAARGLSVDTRGVERITALFYSEDLAALHLTAGELTLVAEGRALPAQARAFALDTGADGWRSLEALAPPLRDLALPAGSELATCGIRPLIAERPLFDGVADEENLTFLVPGGAYGAIAGTTAGKLFAVGRDAVTAFPPLEVPFGMGGAWLQPETSLLWTSRGATLVTVDLRDGTVADHGALPDFVLRMVGPVAATDGAFELFMITALGHLVYFRPGESPRTLGQLALPRSQTAKFRLERDAPGHALLIDGTSNAYALTDTALGPPTTPADDRRCSAFAEPKLTLATRWQDRPALVHACRQTLADGTPVDTEILVQDATGGFVLLPGRTLVDKELRAAAPLGDGGLLLAGAGSTYVRALPSGELCPLRLHGSDGSTSGQVQHHFEHAVALGPGVVALGGPPIIGVAAAPPTVVILTYP